MFTFDKFKYIDHHESMGRIEKGRSEIRSHLLQLTFDFANKISGNISNDDFLNHRNSIQLRLSSILYHYDILASLNISGKEIVTSQKVSPEITAQIALRQDFLFDSIIFHTLSLFDYTSCLIKYIIEKNKQPQRTHWSKIVNLARHQLDFKESKLAQAIDKINKNWVQFLGNYRAELIHYNDDSVNSGLTINYRKSEYTINIFAPLTFKKHFKEFKKEENLKASINEAALWIIENSINAILEIIKELLKFLDTIRKILPGNEVYIVNDMKPSF